MILVGRCHQALLPIVYPSIRLPESPSINPGSSACVSGGAGRGGPCWGLTLSLPQGSLLKVVLEDYLRLKKLFAQRMVQKASSCHSSISEVVGGLGAVCRAPGLGVFSLLLSSGPPSSSGSLKFSSQSPRRHWVEIQGGFTFWALQGLVGVEI